ncbi:hypothetical protein EOA32_03095 [Mesorhizobium sp. M1A.F.Ca.ET.072.01.1.1]|uniref:hypothetical protein n=1 Tax=Mesorhizobium sp. M1A.F.Ca.ET.072.01.1.1 TaxID=2496753 RepID=UPI000FD1D3B1|nr:hypothetical protein [Mesorhizobium sp. M1A.F.Ca.ET.072.01.1.1]RUW55026.1 hypothetical protein EOA32_03095 [Mesorhizobium sp. M1A.F.Ca.ET.072.01.1.1]TIV04738.1 MAG: hypothetical protein E5W04_02320 [Mesorhizobium sp.]
MLKGEFHAVVHCPSCRSRTDVWLYDVPEQDEVSGETTTQDIIEECEFCGCEMDLVIAAYGGGWTAFLAEDPDAAFEIERLDSGYDGWLEELQPEPHPSAIFYQAMHDWTGLLYSMGDRRSGAAAVNRMLLIQLFSIVEAYLSDAIIKLAFDDPNVTQAIVRWHPDLKDERVSLQKVASEPNLVRDMLVSQLRVKTQFHRFEFLHGMLRAAIGHHLLPGDKAERDLILQSVHYRHYCVHRNGRDTDGNILTVLTLAYLDELAARFRALVGHLATAISDRR